MIRDSAAQAGTAGAAAAAGLRRTAERERIVIQKKKGSITMKRAVSVILALVMILSLTACGKSEAAKAADAKIDAIGEVTLDSGTAIANAENAVKALSEEDLNALSGRSKLEKARDTYDALVLMDMIDNMGEITEDSGKVIEDIRSKYSSASENARSAVTNYSIFEAAEATYTELADAAAEKLRAEGEAALATMRLEEDKVQKMSFYYPVGFPEYIDTRTYALCYVGTSSTNTWVRIRYDYVGDDWVFWDHLTFLIDGQTYYRVYRYFDVERDNDHGDVWEYIDFTADDDDLELFAAIAASDETIIRFEGDAKRYDLTVSQQDKDAIRDALAAYAYLSAN